MSRRYEDHLWVLPLIRRLPEDSEALACETVIIKVHLCSHQKPWPCQESVRETGSIASSDQAHHLFIH
jgi:hypothetical protein